MSKVFPTIWYQKFKKFMKLFYIILRKITLARVIKKVLPLFNILKLSFLASVKLLTNLGFCKLKVSNNY